MAQPLIRSDLLGRPLVDVEAVIDDALRIADNPAGYAEALHHQARGVLLAVQYLRGQTELVRGTGTPTTRADVERQRVVIYDLLEASADQGGTFEQRVEAMAVWMMLGYVLGRRHESPLSQVAARAA